MRSKTQDIVFLFLRWIVATIFIVAGITKILNPLTFAEDIDNYQILPYLLVTLMAIILPWLEVLCGFFLIIGKLQKGAALTLMIMTFIFLAAIISGIVRGLDISCGCFTSTTEWNSIGYTRLVEEIIFSVLVVLVYIRSLKVPD